MHMLFVGPPGAGKGTQAAMIAAERGIPQISTGDIFRANVAQQTELGKVAQGYMNAGEYVPDEVTNAMVRDRLREPDAQVGFLLDGYPRTVDQVDTLDAILEELNETLEAVISLEVDTEELIKRLLLRAQTSGRADDTEEVIRYRQQVYQEQTAPLLEIYAGRGLVLAIDGEGTVDEVAERIRAALDDPGNPER